MGGVYKVSGASYVSPSSKPLAFFIPAGAGIQKVE